MEALINGQTMRFDPLTTLGDIAAMYRSKSNLIIIEHNGVVVKQTAWAATAVKDHDQIELITLVGGG
jgi:thiamine biosynthesis protein ThiS